jgi:hypothetical protein
MHWEREIPSDFQAETCVGMPVTAHLKASHPPSSVPSLADAHRTASSPLSLGFLAPLA